MRRLMNESSMKGIEEPTSMTAISTFLSPNVIDTSWREVLNRWCRDGNGVVIGKVR